MNQGELLVELEQVLNAMEAKAEEYSVLLNRRIEICAALIESGMTTTQTAQLAGVSLKRLREILLREGFWKGTGRTTRHRKPTPAEQIGGAVASRAS